MTITLHNPPTVFTPVGPYSHAVEVADARRLLFISGTMGLEADGAVPATIEEQLDVLWSNIVKILAGAGMTAANLVKLTCFLADKSHRNPNMDARRRVLGDHKVATTVVVAGLLESAWLVEIEAIAAA
jgi:2-iminobutanoate/2-iminopropanoate deaminase